MSREEEIQEKAIQFVDESYMDIGIKTTHEASVAACQRMAEWCDSNPRKGLWDAEKVIGWLKKNCTFFDESKGKERCIVNIYALSQAMEE